MSGRRKPPSQAYISLQQEPSLVPTSAPARPHCCHLHSPLFLPCPRAASPHLYCSISGSRLGIKDPFSFSHLSKFLEK